VLDLDGLFDDLRSALGESEPRLAVRDVLRRAVDRPSAVAAALHPRVGGLRVLLHEPDLTVLDAAWAPRMRLMPHDHRIWAVIAVYQGAEDNEFFRRESGAGLVASGGRRIETGDVVMLGESTIHAVTNPTSTVTGAIHVYGGDFLHRPRSQWGPGDLVERPFDLDGAMQQFHDANVAAGLVAG
jgi:predicted metal-dependent enzyme (double-stranded beta helix superfamily)